ncbi:hypothetical protein [Actinopolyspora saharensis]|uniref:hypothetical protein n=1 Tax=Actinopolyspora saharensis TaxID=995062 RepID=UPI003F664F74
MRNSTTDADTAVPARLTTNSHVLFTLVTVTEAAVPAKACAGGHERPSVTALVRATLLTGTDPPEPGRVRGERLYRPGALFGAPGRRWLR